MRRASVLRSVGACAVLALLAVGCAAPAPARCDPPRNAAISVPYWNLNRGAETVRKHASELDSVSPWVYGIAPDGRITAQSSGRPEEAESLENLLTAGPEMVPSITNHFDGDWQREPLAGILHDPERTRGHVDALAQFARDGGYSAIDIDYEDMRAVDGPVFTRFVRELADRLHAEDRRLSVTLAPKTDDDGNSQATRAQDYRAVAEAADSVRIMAYDYHWATSDPGPAAPETWVRDVLSYALTRAPADKVVLGVPEYGYDWSGGYGTSVSSAGALELARQRGIEPNWDAAGGSAWFTYRENGVDHAVWFEDARSTAIKLRLAREYGLNAVHLWSYGPEAPGVWEELDTGWKQACP
ncbi:glycosyl hydrolase family 18 protein [Saccharopolyspora tripterygii]